MLFDANEQTANQTLYSRKSKGVAYEINKGRNMRPLTVQHYDFIRNLFIRESTRGPHQNSFPNSFERLLERSLESPFENQFER